MKNKDFKELLTSIDQARKIHTGKLKTSRVFKFHPSRRRPEGPTLALLKVAEVNPETVMEALHT